MDRDQIRVLWDNMKIQLNEMQKRLYAAALAQAYGYGSATVVHEVNRYLHEHDNSRQKRIGKM
jgi:uncharacterized protein involved in tellurium resistance